jgi:cytochrome c peroxidase
LHDTSTWDLGEAVNIVAEYQLGVTLTDDETKKIVAFHLRTLTGNQPSIIFPTLPPSTSEPNRN